MLKQWVSTLPPEGPMTTVKLSALNTPSFPLYGVVLPTAFSAPHIRHLYAANKSPTHYESRVDF